MPATRSDLAILNGTLGPQQALPVMTNVKNLKYLYQTRSINADKLVILIGGTPVWLSSSSNNTKPCSDWFYYQTVRPADYLLWDSLMTEIAAEISTWGINPHYEIWNEPDLTCFWNGTEQELIELYRHTALALKGGDPNCKVGGIALNNWSNGIAGTTSNNIIGYIPYSFADANSLIAHMIDSCSIENLPLDFISFHYFSVYHGKINNAMDYLKKKLINSGFSSSEIIITEYNTANVYRETKYHAPFILDCFKKFEETNSKNHCIASLQDFSLNSSDEFFQDYGCITRNGIKKPVYYSLEFLNSVMKQGKEFVVTKLDEEFCITSISNDTLKILYSHPVQNPIYGGRNAMYYGSSPVNSNDLIAAGYTSYGKIDSTIAGKLNPNGPPNVQQAFFNANLYYNWAVRNIYTNDTIIFRFSGWKGIKNARMWIVDSTHNNNIYIYDSLITAGYSNNAAINYIITNQKLSHSNIQIFDSIHKQILQPNSVYFIEVYGFLTSIHENFVFNNCLNVISPNPASEYIEISLSPLLVGEGWGDGVRIFDILGMEITTPSLSDTPRYQGGEIVRIDISHLLPGVYFVRVGVVVRKFVKV
jgi:hypothetical protein